MTLDLLAIGVIGLCGLIYATAIPPRLRSWFLFIGSVVAVFWLQTFLFIRHADFLLPTLTLCLTLVTWAFIRQPDTPQGTLRENWPALVLVVVLLIALSFFRFLPAPYRLTPSRPPDPLLVILLLALFALLVVALARVLSRPPAGAVSQPARRHAPILSLAILGIVALFVVLKSDALATAASRGWRMLSAQDVTLASPADLTWIGFSYIAFRLIHVLRDRQNGILPSLSLREFVIYVVFTPSFIAGPIDRAERFVVDLRALPQLRGLDPTRMTLAFWHIGWGMLRKFVVADTLAQGMALNPTNATQVTSTPWLWLLLYGYALRLYFDFAGYTSIAIGLGLLFGIRLPENFDRPYFKTNITTFWQSWHMTLSNWARFYVFTPLSRALLRRKPRPSPTLILFIAHLLTMLTIGLWHGITWNFFIWGLWHAVALFVHKLWSDRTRGWYRRLQERPRQKQLWTAASWFLTFHYVAIGWVWFLLPTPTLALQTAGRLFGIGW
jgi:D-alanyl-lipoteichoic acid acyltransferase DltB (MBOAT superfamily)